MTLKFNRLRTVVEIHVLAKFHQVSAVVHELSWSEKKNSNENNTVHRYRADSKNKLKTGKRRKP